ncbi:MAG: DUF2179 domain-containing protein [Actinobacteria bacterium]|nr:DUF2179 domain-containing protein [Actinomycetota bacterium]
MPEVILKIFSFNLNTLAWSLIVFAAILTQILVGTVRTIIMVKGKRVVAMIIGFFEAAIALTIAITVISHAVREGVNFFIILSYAFGFALGLLLGMIISQKISKDILSINVVTRNARSEIEDALRAGGFGVTCYSGSGKDGNLKVLNVVCQKKNLGRLKLIVSGIDKKAMLTSHTIEGLSGGFLFDIKSRI